jgi:uncharacterized FAD-dependent dehydrogenase
MRGYLTNDAIPCARIKNVFCQTHSRDPITYEHLQIKLYPCGEGAGYAGGIISAAIDGRNVL